MAAAALVVLVASVAEARAAVLSFAETGAQTPAQVVSCTRYDPIARVYDRVVSSSSTHGSADARLGVSAGQEPIVAAMSGTSVASPGQSTSMGSTYDSDVRPPDVTHASGEIDQSANDLPGVVLSSGCCSSATNSARGISNLGGVIAEEGATAAGGRLYTATGAINQNDFAGIVNSGLMRGDRVHIITGAHGSPNGTFVPDTSMYADDVARFGELPGVSIHNLPAMSQTEVRQVVNGPGTIIGGFCDSSACLAGFR